MNDVNDFILDLVNAGEALTEQKPTETASELAVALKKVVAANGPDIYRDCGKLAAALRSMSVPEPRIKQVELAVCGCNLPRYLDKLASGLSAIDMNNMILLAQKAGLSSEAARQVVEDLLFSLNVRQVAKDVTVKPGTAGQEYVPLYIPPTQYTADLKEITDCVNSKKKLIPEQFTKLNQLLAAGVPEAHTLMGRIYTIGTDVPKDETKAMEHWKFAASHGDGAAYGYMGDYYYGKNNKLAYRMYSRPGALALNEERWGKFRDLEKTKRFNRTQLFLFAGLYVLISIFMFAFHASVITGPHLLGAILCVVVGAAVTGVTAFVHIRNPYQDLRNYSLGLLIPLLIFLINVI